jgi:hypothetical protein
MIWLGAAASSLRDWRDERGLWMLAIVVLMSSVFVAATVLYGFLIDFGRAVLNERALTIELVLAECVFFYQCVFAAAVLKRSWSLRKHVRSGSIDDK